MYAKYLLRRAKFGKAKLWNVSLKLKSRIGNNGGIRQECSTEMSTKLILDLLNGDT